MAQRGDKGLGVGPEVGDERTDLRAQGGRMSVGLGAPCQVSGRGEEGRLRSNCQVSLSSVTGAKVPVTVIGQQRQGSDFPNACVRVQMCYWKGRI